MLSNELDVRYKLMNYGHFIEINHVDNDKKVVHKIDSVKQS